MSPRPTRVALLTSTFVIILGALAPASSGEQSGSAEWHGPDRVLVGVDGSRKEAAAAIRAVGGRIVAYHDGGFFEVDPPSSAATWADGLEDPAIGYAEPEQIGTLDAVPDDPLWANQWGLDRVGAPDAWDRATGSADVVVALVDSGLDSSHEDLAGNVWTNDAEVAANGIDDDGNGYVDDVAGIDCRNDDVDPFDDFFHGTHVAGTIGAIGDNATGVAGVNWDIRLMALKWTNHFGQGMISDAVECLDYAIENGARIVNASWGFDAFSQTLADAIDRAEAAGVLVVASAGNDARNITTGVPRYPASLENPNLLTVAATDHTDGLASFSNFGAGVDLAAPGVDIWSTQPYNDYWVSSGTSFSASYVTGAAALYASAVPGASVSQMIDRILTTAEPVPSLSGLVASGALLDLGSAIPDAIAPAAPTGLTANEGDAQVSLDWNDSPEPDLDTYVVERTTDPPEATTRTWLEMAVTPSSDAIDVGLTNGATYHYRVLARDLAGNTSEPSAEVSATPVRAPVDSPLTTISVTSGTSQGDPVSHVAASDDLRYGVLGKSKKTSSSASWEGSTTVDRAGAVSMTLRFEANASATGTAAIYVRGAAGKSGWTLAGSLPLGNADATFTWSTSAVSTYTTAAGLVRVRVTFQAATGGAVFGTDLASVRTHY